jgi:hypothetical protein
MGGDTVARPFVAAGSEAWPHRGLCDISSGAADKLEGKVGIGWTAEGRLLSSDADSARVAIRWTRRVTNASLAVAADMVREYEADLHDGSMAVIDFLRPAPGFDPDCDGVVVKLGVRFTDPPALAGQSLDYELWFVHRDAAGSEVVERSRGRSIQGKAVDFVFPSIQYDAAGRRDRSGPVSVDYSGSVRGRVRPDGRIDLLVAARRMTIENSLGQGSGGSKQATVADGETLELEMPTHSDRGPGFESQRTSIRVTVRRVS